MAFVTLECECGRRLDRLSLGPEVLGRKVQSAGTPGAHRRRAATFQGSSVNLADFAGSTEPTAHDRGVSDAGPMRYQCRGCGRRFVYPKVDIQRLVEKAISNGRRRLTAGVDA